MFHCPSYNNQRIRDKTSYTNYRVFNNKFCVRKLATYEYVRKWASSVHSIYDWRIPILGCQARPFLYPGHIRLGNRPQMYRILGNELNLWIGVILITGRLGYRSFLYPGQIILGNWPHMFDNGSHLSAWDVLSLGTFCPWDVLSWKVLSWHILYVRLFRFSVFYLYSA